VRFITSIWAGTDLGSYLVNDTYSFESGPGGKFFRNLSEVLLDGQQRLTALEGYLRGTFAVPDARGVLRRWNDLGKVERRRFCATTFVRSTVRSFDEALLRKAYDLRAFGGTAHTDDERASPAA
jgi:hypothetical protein